MAEDDVRGLVDERRRLLHELEVERNQLMRNIETCRIRDIDRPFVGEWSLKDIVGHIASWEAEFVTGLRDHAEGRPSASAGMDDAAVDKWNEDHVQRMRPINFWNLLEQLRAGRERLLQGLAGVSDDDLTTAGTRPNRILAAVIEHDREHWHEIAACLAGVRAGRVAGSATARPA
ncbi:MAG: DinB family protein [Tepidiformaceae bacterium]